MIETASTAGHIAENAAAALKKIHDEYEALRANIEAMQVEKQALLGEHSELHKRANDLAALTGAALADTHRANLEQELAAGTEWEERANARARETTQLWDACRADEKTHAAMASLRGPEIDARLEYLDHSIQDASKMLQGLSARRFDLEHIHNNAHAQYGKDISATIETEFATIEADRAAAMALLAEIETKQQALIDAIPQRLQQWPAMARELLASYLPDKPGATRELLLLWQRLATLYGDVCKQVDSQLIEAYVTRQALPLWHLQTYGPRSHYETLKPHQRAPEIQNYEVILQRLAADIARLEAKEQEQHIHAHMAGAAQ